MLKSDELRTAHSCLNKAASDEPIFVLRAKDALAPQAVRLWAAMADGVHEIEKRGEAMGLAEEMDRWRKAQTVPVPAPEASQGYGLPFNGRDKRA